MEPGTDTVLSQKLRELPLATPPGNGFEMIRAQLELAAPRERRRRFDATAWLGLAASIGLAAVLLFGQPAPTTAPRLISIDPAVLALIERSQALERDIRTAASPDVDEFRYAVEASIQNELALIDAGLAAVPIPDKSLWSERVRLLEELRTVSQTDTGTLLMQASVD